jgi:hypothetical protein
VLLPLILLSTPPSISFDAHHVLARFDPRSAFGAGIDGHEQGDEERMLSSSNVRLMRSMGYQSLTYRLRTELGDEVWHWNPRGSWSDAARSQGYWTSSGDPHDRIWLSYGYRLPRRGNTIDQANRDDYSRLDDGDLTTFWKSNPYLDPAYTAISYRESPQWIVVVFDKPTLVSEVQIHWATPFATKFVVEYAVSDDFDLPWLPLTGELKGHTGEQHVSFPAQTVRCLRIRLDESSHTVPAGAADPRDKFGFAAREVSVGSRDAHGTFHDIIQHAKSNQKQSMIYVSSTDPWHRESDRDSKTEQPGFDMMLDRGLTNNQPVLIPTGCLFDTPENVGAEVRWLKGRNIPLRGLELGEEPDGNWTDPDQYAALYLQMANVVRRTMPTVRIGGPSLQTVVDEYREFPRPGGEYLLRIRHHLTARKRQRDFSFVTFEWYPFDDVWKSPAVQLPIAKTNLEATVKRLNDIGMKGLPWMITEYGWSAYAAQPEVEPAGGIFDFEVALRSLELGAEATFLYGYEPGEPMEELPGAWGNNMALESLDAGTAKLPAYYTAWLVSHALCAASGKHELLSVQGETDSIGAYAAKQPSGGVALAVVNRSPTAQQVLVPQGRYRAWSYSSNNYTWKPDGTKGHPIKDDPPFSFKSVGGLLRLPAYGIVILRPVTQ